MYYVIIGGYMKKIIIFIIFLLISGIIFCEEIEKSTFENLINVFYTRYDHCQMVIVFTAEGFSNMNDNRLHYYLLSADMGFETYKQMFQISKKNLNIYIYYGDETFLGYVYNSRNRNEYFRNLNNALRILENY